MKCQKCNSDTERLFHGLCKKCYGKQWDEAFSSQADYSDKMYELEKKKDTELNKKVNVSNPKEKDIQKSIDSKWTGTVECTKCHNRRVSMKKYEKLRKEEKLLEHLKLPCSKCGTVGYLYFH